ncbi:DNA-binding protein [Echinicola pacifica]|uniref:DNA-binding protein n=1 Tax=Echinicola pacifica TaxID=346377 RepID=A0A918UTK8_9BACT|nr:glycosyl hydrolase [Echinicola pacifica]GGZ34114.1 DNA-binding protein [Echinicola pacifica]
MSAQKVFFLVLLVLAFLPWGSFAFQVSQLSATVDCEEDYDPAKPWVYWYWMYSAYSREGITADLEAMREAGLAGAYLMSIKGPAEPAHIDPPTLQGSEEWWEMVRFAMEEADRLGLKLAMHACDGFAVAGGPWISPELSMQKVVWTDTVVNIHAGENMRLALPENYEGYYRDLAVFAFPVRDDFERSSEIDRPTVSSDISSEDLDFLLDDRSPDYLATNEEGWVQYEFEKAFTCRSIRIKTHGNSYQAHRLRVLVCDDGEGFREVYRLKAPRHGWQDWDYDYSHAIPETTAKYYRFVYDKQGTEPGAEDLDAAKWKPSFKVSTIALSSRPVIDQYEGKSAAVWRISEELGQDLLPIENCVSLAELKNISQQMDENGRLKWVGAGGKWRIMRFGYTSTGHTNYTGGGAKGLEVDKFNAKAVRLQFDKWYGEALRRAGPELAEEVLKIFHIDSWEAGSQNWSPGFEKEFLARRGYDIMDFLPVLAGVPLISADQSERLLYDLRLTISELVMDSFFGTLQEEAHKNGVLFSAENVAPTMVTDGMEHFRFTDLPAGEFWLNSPTHDKPNDMRDAVSAGHIYGKQIIQAEAFTQLRMDWNEYPGMLKTLGDRNYALGVNRFFYHVFVHNPWVDRKPGMTLDGIGLYFQRDQTWWKPGRAWVDYAERVQHNLQKGSPVIDIAVFTGEGLPSRALLPERLLPVLPGLFGEDRVREEVIRWRNEGQPTREKPAGVKHSANIADAENWTDPLRGYHYDSFNKDALLRLAYVEEGKVRFADGSSYEVLVFPGKRKMNPNAERMSVEVAAKILEIVKDGATVFMEKLDYKTLGFKADEAGLKEIFTQLFAGSYAEDTEPSSWPVGRGRVYALPFEQPDFSMLEIPADVLVTDDEHALNQDFAFAHRRTEEEDLYFLSNQAPKERLLTLSFRIMGRKPVLYDPVVDREYAIGQWIEEEDRTIISLKFPPNGSLFVHFRDQETEKEGPFGRNWYEYKEVMALDGAWKLEFDPEYGGPESIMTFEHLVSWTERPEPSIKYYSGTAIYRKKFTLASGDKERLWLYLGEVNNIASVRINGKDCGVAWTFPYQVYISEAIEEEENLLEIEVSNTWANRLMGDQLLPAEERITSTIADLERLEGKALLPAGLIGPLRILKEY